jgi:isopenicillin N synthase-like dioxygenase
MTQDAAIPLIDVGPLIGGQPDGEADVARALGRACRDIGFFYVTGHGIPTATIDAVFSQARRFFAAPAPIQDPVRYTGASGNRGHVPVEGEKLQPGTLPDLKECFNIGLELAADDPELLAGKPFRHANPWPDQPGFRQTMLDYFGQVHRLGMALHRALARDLGIDRSFFDDKLSKPMAILRLLHYPAAPAAPRPGQLGAGEHTDYGNLTLLATDGVEGLMVRNRAGTWISAPTVPGALICNIGDCLMRWTNDVYVSTPHRVVSPKGRDRYSVVFFLDPNPEAVVACLPTCLKDGVAKYPPVVAADYLLSRLEPTYKHASTVIPTGARSA